MSRYSIGEANALILKTLESQVGRGSIERYHVEGEVTDLGVGAANDMAYRYKQTFFRDDSSVLSASTTFRAGSMSDDEKASYVKDRLSALVVSVGGSRKPINAFFEDGTSTVRFSALDNTDKTDIPVSREYGRRLFAELIEQLK